MNNKHSEKKGKEPHPYTEYLVIRDGDPLWVSEAISLTSEDGSLIDWSNVHPGTAYFVNAVIENQGEQHAVGVYVQFYWRAPNIAEDSGYHLIGDPVFVPSIMGQSSLTVSSSSHWIPIDSSTSAHRCILVNCFTFTDPIPEGNEFKYKTDRHVAQRNLTLFMAKAGTKKRFTLKAGIAKKPRAKKEQRTILIHSHHTKQTNRLLAELGISIFKSGVFLSERHLDDLNFHIGKVCASKHTLVMTPGISVEIDVTFNVPKDAKKGETWVFSLTQERDQQSKKGEKRHSIVDDGYTAVVIAE